MFNIYTIFIIFIFIFLNYDSLYVAVQNNDFEIVQLLLARNDIDVNSISTISNDIFIQFKFNFFFTEKFRMISFKLCFIFIIQ